MDRKVAEAIRQQSDDLRDELKELQEWEQHISSSRSVCSSSKVVGKQIELSSTVEPPIRGTVTSIKEAMQSKLQELQAKNAKVQVEERSQVEIVKTEGNEFFAKREYENALKMYETGIQVGAEKSTESILYANKAMCYLKLQNWQAAEREATLSLSANPSFVKAYYRRAVARKNIGNLSAARSDLESVLALSPNDVNATRELQEVIKLLQWQREQSVPINLTKRRVVIEEVSSDDSDGDDGQDENKNDVKLNIESKPKSSVTATKNNIHSSNNNVGSNIDDESSNYSNNATDNNVSGKQKKIDCHDECITTQADWVNTTCTSTSSGNNELNEEGKELEEQQSITMQASTEYKEFDGHRPHQATTLTSNNKYHITQNVFMEDKENTNDNKTYNKWKLRDEASFRAAVRDAEEMRAAKTDLEWQRMQSRLRTSERVEIVADEEEYTKSKSGNSTNKVEVKDTQNQPKPNERNSNTKTEMKANALQQTATAAATATAASKNVLSPADVQQNANNTSASGAKAKVSHEHTNTCLSSIADNVKNISKENVCERSISSERWQKNHDDICVHKIDEHAKFKCVSELAKTGNENNKNGELFSTKYETAIARKKREEEMLGRPERKVSEENKCTQKVLQRPKTFTEFERQVSKLENHNDELIEYIKLLSPDELQSFFGSNITAEILYTLLRAISALPVEQKIKYLVNICKVRRVGEVVLFFSCTEKEYTSNLVASLSNTQITPKQLSFIKKKLSVN